MASVSAASQLDDLYVAIDGADHTVNDSYLGGGFTDSVGDLQPSAYAGEGGWSGPNAGRHAFGGETAKTAGADLHTLDDGTYLGGGFTDSVGEMVPGKAALGGWNGPTSDRPSVGGGAETATFVPAGNHNLEGGANTYIAPGFSETGHGIQPDQSAGLGGIIPTAYFRTVTGYVLDEDGDPIESGMYLIALDNFAVASDVDEHGWYSLRLLRQEYQQFILVADAPENEPGKEYDYVWYEAEGNPVVDTRTHEADLRFTQVDQSDGSDDSDAVQQAKGLLMSHGVRMGL